jgi:hypothetical protein
MTNMIYMHEAQNGTSTEAIKTRSSKVTTPKGKRNTI